MDKDVKTVMATVFNALPDRITALDSAGQMHHLSWNGKSPVYKSLRPGDLVIVHYTPSFEGEVHAFEVPSQTSPEAPGDEQEAQDG